MIGIQQDIQQRVMKFKVRIKTRDGTIAIEWEWEKKEIVNGGSDSNRFERIPSEGGKVIKVDDARVKGS